jgi:hypothetical protein
MNALALSAKNSTVATSQTFGPSNGFAQGAEATPSETKGFSMIASAKENPHPSSQPPPLHAVAKHVETTPQMTKSISSPVVGLAQTSAPTINEMKSPKPSRRASSTADILPYLQKAPDIPASSRSLRHLALLESVASEAQISPRVTTRAASAAPFERQTHPYGTRSAIPSHPQFSTPPHQSPVAQTPYTENPPYTSMANGFQVHPVSPSSGFVSQVAFPSRGYSNIPLSAAGLLDQPRVVEPALSSMPHNRSLSFAYGRQQGFATTPLPLSNADSAVHHIPSIVQSRSLVHTSVQRPMPSNHLLSILNGASSPQSRS